MSKINKHELCFKSIISALHQLDKLGLGSYEQRSEVIVTLLNKFEIINTEKLQSIISLQKKLSIMEKRVENLLESVEYYADKGSYTMDDYQGISGEMRSFCILYGDREEINDVTSYAGARARESQVKDLELQKEMEGLKS